MNFSVSEGTKMNEQSGQSSVSRETSRLNGNKTMQIRVDKIASVCHRLNLHKEEQIITENLQPVQGNITVVRSLGEKSVYGELELEEGRMAKIFENDYIIGALGSRNALKGYVGTVPATLKAGEIINMLNLGGVIGICTGVNKDLGPPLKVEVVGQVVRKGRILNLNDATIPTHDHLDPKCRIPIIAVSGTCMSAGKTKVCATLCQQLSQRGLHVNAGKLSGVAARKDLFSFEDHGADMTLSFVDCGLPSTADIESIAPIAKSIINELWEDKPDVVVVELGDGIIGGYSVMTYFDDAELYAATRAHICCANDPVGAYGAKAVFDKRGQKIDLFSGPVTDNEVGCGYIVEGLGIKAINARNDAEELADEVCRLLGWNDLVGVHKDGPQAG
ncbi:MAG: hypothetical protein IT463_14735 [Planctomycetes bacterium]|nr:hypothetical protein [Planctomycetota bacterium]